MRIEIEVEVEVEVEMGAERLKAALLIQLRRSANDGDGDERGGGVSYRVMAAALRGGNRGLHAADRQIKLQRILDIVLAD